MSSSTVSYIKKLSHSLPLTSVQKRRGYHWVVVMTVCIGAFMAALDASIVNIALPTLKNDFHVHMNQIEWVSLVYLLTLAAVIIPFGRLADIFGRRWMYAFGFLVFVIGSLFCGTAMTLAMLLVCRVLQAIGAAMLQANSVSIITAATPAHDRGKAIGIQASAQGVGLSLGPVIGGVLISTLGWRWIFLINVPVGLIGILCGVLLLPRDNMMKNRPKFDYLGALFLGPALVSLIYVLNMGLKQGWTAPWVVVSYFIFAVCLFAFVFIERKSPSPMLDLALFRIKPFTLGTMGGILSFAAMYAVLLLAPFYLSYVEKLSPLRSGMYLTVIPIGMTLLTPIAGAIADRFGSRMPTRLGMGLVVMGCIVLGVLSTPTSDWIMVLGLGLVGAGVGIFTPPNNSSVMGHVPTSHLGVTGGMLNMSRTLGMGIGVTLGGFSYQFFLSLQGVENSHFATSVELLKAFEWSYIAVAVVASMAWLTTLTKKRKGTLD